MILCFSSCRMSECYLLSLCVPVFHYHSYLSWISCCSGSRTALSTDCPLIIIFQGLVGLSTTMHFVFFWHWYSDLFTAIINHKGKVAETRRWRWCTQCRRRHTGWALSQHSLPVKISILLWKQFSKLLQQSWLKLITLFIKTCYFVHNSWTSCWKKLSTKPSTDNSGWPTCVGWKKLFSNLFVNIYCSPTFFISCCHSLYFSLRIGTL